MCEPPVGLRTYSRTHRRRCSIESQLSKDACRDKKKGGRTGITKKGGLRGGGERNPQPMEKNKKKNPLTPPKKPPPPRRACATQGGIAYPKTKKKDKKRKIGHGLRGRLSPSTTSPRSLIWKAPLKIRHCKHRCPSSHRRGQEYLAGRTRT